MDLVQYNLESDRSYIDVEELINKYNFDSIANVISYVLYEIGKADKTLAKDVSDLEKKIHPNSPLFQINEVGGEMICKFFGYDSKNPNNLTSMQEYRDGKCCKSQMFKDGKLVYESNYKDEKLDGVSVMYDDNGAISHVGVYDKGKETHSVFAVNSKINKLSNGVFV